MDKVDELKRRLAALPGDPDEDGTLGTDGSYESLAEVYEEAFQIAYSVAIDAIRLLETASH